MWYGIFLLMILLGYVQVARAEIYKCPDGKGGIVLKNEPCDGSSAPKPPPAAVQPPTPELQQPASGEVKVPRQPITSNPTVDAAFKALRKIMAATEVGINMRDYGQLVVEAKATVNDIVLDSSASKDARIQKELEEAMQAYADALTGWNLSLEDNLGKSFFVGKYNQKGVYLNTKYNFTKKSSDLVDKQNALNIIWKSAKAHLTSATELAK